MPASARLEKEVRAMFWPWLAVVSLAALHVVWDPRGYSLFGFFLGVPVLAAFSFGHEFHHSTMAQLLSLPASRTRIWTEKLLVMLVAVATASAAYAYVWRSELGRVQLLGAGLYLLTMTAPAAYFTLVARSTLGGAVLSWVPLKCFWLVALVCNSIFPGSLLGSWPVLLQGTLRPDSSLQVVAFLAPLVVSYAAFMFWLGARKLERFHVTGEGADGDMLANLPRLLPQRVAAMFEPQPTEPWLNLVRKELRLLRPVWLLAMLFLVYVACLLSLGIGFPSFEAKENRVPIREIALILPFASFVPMMALLAGCLAVGEERKWGTHSWHLTLPVSIRRQWFTKLLTSVSTGTVCGAVLPALLLMVASKAEGSPVTAPTTGDVIQWFAVVAMFTFAAFWCAGVANSTVRGALWVLPVYGIIGFAASYGVRWAEKLLLTTGSLRDFLVARFQLDPSSFQDLTFSRFFWIWIILPVSAVALWQSHKLYRTQPQESMVWMIRRVLPLALVALLSSFALMVAGAVTWHPYDETLMALEKLKAGSTPGQFEAADLLRATPLSARTLRWLRGARITVEPDPVKQSYVAKIHLANGLDCKMEIKRFAVHRIYWRTAVCQPRGS